ncbi:MAG: chromosomal replication initiator protein DnaA [Bacteroidales bacterium]|jgi:chromosomal replication initiator protein|nr:chromosomal replication initiator protein DnaA [Bacteroidales bacterium]MBO7529886.1 chromosomal replication initiator protein DnaA [Bacteroidales bacterium]
MSKNLYEIWNECLAMIRENVPPQAYSTWFEPIKPVDFKNGLLTIQVPSDFFYEFLETHYIKVIKATIRKVLGPEGKLEYSIMMDNNVNKPVVVKQPSVDRTNTKNPPKQIQIDFENTESKILNPFALPGIKKVNIESNLNENYCMENFVVGDCNRVAYEAGLAVSKNPGRTAFNPMFVFSPTGMGKTHICQAIGLETKKHHPELTVLYVNAEQFLMQFQASCRNNSSKSSRDDFVHFYQMIDVLIIDDIQFLSGKPKTQDTLFHIFNHLQQTGKQLIFTCDKPPAEIKDMEQRLISRFKWGLSAEMSLPDVETRRNILKRKAYNEGVELPEDVVNYIAEHIKTNVREMEGFLISLIAQSSLNRKSITISLAKQMVERFVNNSNREITITYIINAVCEEMGTSQADFFTKSRKRNIVQARQLSMYFSKKYTKAPLITIGEQCGGKDHATVIHALKTVANLLDTDKQFRAIADKIEQTLQ